MAHRDQRISLRHLREHLVCVLCGGYLIDATTIVECLHSFCKTCIVRYLDSSKFCPICDVQVHKTKPLINIRMDHTLQDMVYKLVPGLFQEEMKRRREFYKEKIDEEEIDGPWPEYYIDDDGEVQRERVIFSDDEQISLCLQLSADGKPPKSPEKRDQKSSNEMTDCRYLLCPAAVTVSHLKKFIRLKFNLCDRYQIDVYHSDEALLEHYTLIDIAYIYAWRRKGPLRLFYTVYTNPAKKLKRCASSTVTSDITKDTDIVEMSCNSQKTDNTDSTIKSVPVNKMENRSRTENTENSIVKPESIVGNFVPTIESKLENNAMKSEIKTENSAIKTATVNTNSIIIVKGAGQPQPKCLESNTKPSMTDVMLKESKPPSSSVFTGLQGQVSSTQKDRKPQVSNPQLDRKSQNTADESKAKVSSADGTTKTEASSTDHESTTKVSNSQTNSKAQVSHLVKDAKVQGLISIKDTNTHVSSSEKEVKEQVSSTQKDINLQVTSTQAGIKAHASTTVSPKNLKESNHSNKDKKEAEKPRKLEVTRKSDSSCPTINVPSPSRSLLYGLKSRDKDGKRPNDFCKPKDKILSLPVRVPEPPITVPQPKQYENASKTVTVPRPPALLLTNSKNSMSNKNVSSNGSKSNGKYINLNHEKQNGEKRPIVDSSSTSDAKKIKYSADSTSKQGSYKNGRDNHQIARSVSVPYIAKSPVSPISPSFSTADKARKLLQVPERPYYVPFAHGQGINIFPYRAHIQDYGNDIPQDLSMKKKIEVNEKSKAPEEKKTNGISDKNKNGEVDKYAFTDDDDSPVASRKLQHVKSEPVNIN